MLWGHDVGLLQDKLAEEKSEYIDAFMAVVLIAKKTNDPIEEVAKYLLHNEFENRIETYAENHLGHFHSCDDDFINGCFHKTWEILNGIVSNSSTAFHEYAGTYWKKSAFFELDLIKELKVTDNTPPLKTIPTISKAPKPISPVSSVSSAPTQKRTDKIQDQSNYGTPTVGHADPTHYQQQRDQLQKENEQLKTDLAQAKAHITELEANQQNNLLDLIFDETAKHRYAPDLVLAIKLWEDLYVTNPTSDSHSNRANTWIKNNTPYTNENTVEVKRLREVISPFQGWHIDRKNKFNNN